MKHSPWKDIFQLFREEKKALLLFTILLFIILGIKFSMPYIIEPATYDFKKFKRFVASQDSFHRAQIKSNEIVIDSTDINLADTTAWQKLGFSPKQARVIVNYRAKIGGFDAKEDLLDVFVVSEKAYGRIEPFLLVGESQEEIQKRSSFSKSKSTYSKKSYKKEKNRDWKWDTLKRDKWKTISRSSVVVELNTADSTALVSLYGIGPYFSSKILKYRNRLGGFYTVNQLSEIRNLKQETIDDIADEISIDTSRIKKININECTFKELLKHPYLDYYFTKKIFQYKDDNGKFTYLRDLKNIEFIDSTYFEKIRPYLSVD